jgi:hypothetical protein
MRFGSAGMELESRDWRLLPGPSIGSFTRYLHRHFRPRVGGRNDAQQDQVTTPPPSHYGVPRREHAREHTAWRKAPRCLRGALGFDGRVGTLLGRRGSAWHFYRLAAALVYSRCTFPAGVEFEDNGPWSSERQGSGKEAQAEPTLMRHIHVCSRCL